MINAEVVLESFLRSSVQIASASAQSAASGSETVTSAVPSGVTPICQRWFFPRCRRRASVTLPPVTVNARSSSVS